MDTLELLSEENKALKKEIEAFRKNEKLFEALVETAVGDIGEEFFNKIVEKLSEWLNAECVIIGQLVNDNMVKGFPMYLDGKLLKGFTYHLKDTPCDLTSKKGYCVYEKNVKAAFPKAKDIEDLNIQGYVGTALYNKQGDVSGILCLMSRNELRLPPQSEAILRIVGARIASEIERIKVQKALQVSEMNLKKAISSKDKLFSIISHDLRTPFNALIGFSKIMMNKLEELELEKTKKYIKIIHDVSNQTFYLLTNLLDWTLAQTGEIKYSPCDCNLSRLIEDTLNTQRYFTQHKKINLDVLVDPELEVYTDSNMFATILRNLISNAVKFTSPGGKITVSAVSDSKQITISVSDTGVGMKPALVKKLFKSDDIFSSNGTDDEKGAGIGLNLCKELVKRQNGNIWVNSQPGIGSEFCFSIPLKEN